MNLRQIFDINNANMSVSGFFAAYGSFGSADGTQSDIEKITATEKGYIASYDDFISECVFENFDNGVVSRQDFFTAKKDIVLNKYCSRFLFEGGDYDVYTQNSCWLTESFGGWQPLVTGVEIANRGIRTTEGATPMVAIRNKGNGKIFVLHLLPNAMWKIKISKIPVNNQNMGIVVETGINDSGLNMVIKKDETIKMPRLFMFEAISAIDLDAWKLHSVYNSMYPRKNLPVMYNTWMLHFDTIDIDNVFNQIDCAAELGVEQFLIDAGWFGNGENWSGEIGVWEENLTGGFCGRLKELAEYIISKGMKFGFWIEPERALTSTKPYKTHPEYYVCDGVNAFLDFSNCDARKYITDIVIELIERYDAKCLKFDFNASLAHDTSGNGFYRYFEGLRCFLKEIREKFPDIYITNCASGGYRMELENGIYYDSVWSSDNQSPIYGFRIFKDTALRLPPCHIEKWDVRRFCNGFPQYGNKDFVSLPLSCNGGTWENVLNVKSEYTHGFLTGGPIGFSTDIASYPDEEKQALKQHIAQFKLDRDFYKNATVRILHDVQDITVLQYSDTDLEKIKIQVFTNVVNQSYITVYPVLNEKNFYVYNDEIISADELMTNGIKVDLSDINCITINIQSS